MTNSKLKQARLDLEAYLKGLPPVKEVKVEDPMFPLDDVKPEQNGAYGGAN